MSFTASINFMTRSPHLVWLRQYGDIDFAHIDHALAVVKACVDRHREHPAIVGFQPGSRHFNFYDVAHFYKLAYSSFYFPPFSNSLRIVHSSSLACLASRSQRALVDDAARPAAKLLPAQQRDRAGRRARLGNHPARQLPAVARSLGRVLQPMCQLRARHAHLPGMGVDPGPGLVLRPLLRGRRARERAHRHRHIGHRRGVVSGDGCE